MSATAFLRHRRAVAVRYINAAMGRSPKALTKILEEFALTPADLRNLDRNNDVLLIADRVAAEKLDEPELDSLEELNTVDVGPRSAVHSPDVRADQFEDELQHPAQETVGVGNMHDGPEAAADLLNVGSPEIEAAIPREERAELDLLSPEAVQRGVDYKLARIEEAEGSDNPVDRSALAEHSDLPSAPSVAPAAQEDVAPAATEDGGTEGKIDPELLAASAAESAQPPADPPAPDAGAEPTGVTGVDLEGAAAAVKAEVKAEDKLAAKGEAAIDGLDRDALIAYAATNNIDLGDVKERTTPATLRTRIKAALKPAEESK